MSAGSTSHHAPRVREQARDVVMLMAFSAAVSGLLALVLLLVTTLARQA